MSRMESVRQEDFAVRRLRDLISRSDAAAASEGWRFGASAQAEIATIINRMPDRLPSSPVQQAFTPTIDDGGLASYLLAGCSAPKHLVHSTRGSEFTLMAGVALLQDVVRSKRLVLSINEAIRNLLSQGLQQVSVVDAGSGPVALLGLCAALASEKVQVTCVELHPDSIDFSRQIIKKFGLSERVKIVSADARSHRHDKPIDLLLSETMSVGLSNEPMVQIMANYKPQMSRTGIMIPSRVVVKACVAEISSLKNPSSWVFSRYSWQPVVSHSWITVADYLAGSSLDRIFCELDLSKLPEGNYLAMLSSDVHCGSFVLADYESYLTLPIAVDNLGVCGSPLKFEINDGPRRPKTVQIDFVPGGSRWGQLIY